MRGICLLLFFCVCTVEADDRALRVHVLAASEEYSAAESTTRLASYMAKKHKVDWVVSAGNDKAKQLPLLDQVKNADVLVVFARRLNLPEKDMALIRAHWEAGKPVVGIRTASHAFQQADNEFFDKKVLGGNYQGHYKNEPITVLKAENAGKHPVFKGVPDEFLSSRLYKTGPQIDSVQVLQRARVNEDSPWQSVTWCHEYKGGRMFYTSLGVEKDFEQNAFLMMMTNAILWVSDKEKN